MGRFGEDLKLAAACAPQKWPNSLRWTRTTTTSPLGAFVHIFNTFLKCLYFYLSEDWWLTDFINQGITAIFQKSVTVVIHICAGSDVNVPRRVAPLCSLGEELCSPIGRRPACPIVWTLGFTFMLPAWSAQALEFSALGLWFSEAWRLRKDTTCFFIWGAMVPVSTLNQ